MFNEPRNAAVYLMRKIRRDRLEEIGERFGIGKYSSVSSMIEGVKQRLRTDRSFRKSINDLHRSIINSQKQTPF
jgi:chromosomal replication initiation ATPase DnaA